MRDAVAAEYRALKEEAVALRAREGGGRRRSLARLRRELHRIRARDYFVTAERDQAQRAIEALAAQLEEPVRWGGRQGSTAISTAQPARG
jgi:hypothetical protein